MRGLRKQMQMIFQDPFSSLNPRKTIAQIIGEPLLVHGMKNRKQREERVLYLLDVVGLRPEQMRRYPHMFSGGQRQRIGVAIFQEPMTSLNPVFTVGEQVGEVIRLHQHFSRKETLRRVVEIFQLVGIPAPLKRLSDYPHQMSGGMRQRVMIAMALACNPKLMIADEPTTALDVTIQAQILDLMNKLKDETGAAILFITHDLGVIAEMAQHVAVMYAGKMMEYADVETLFADPKHPYTVGLMQSIPVLGRKTQDGRLSTIKGVVPSLFNLPGGCLFSDRCPDVFDDCRRIEPDMYGVGDNHTARCLKYA